MDNGYQGKKLLVLAAAGVHSKVVRAAREMGLYVIVTDNIPDSPAKAIADESWMYSITEVDAIAERCRAEGVDGVLNFCIDPGQRPYQQICEKLGLPCYCTGETLSILTDKRTFKDYCLAHGVDVIPDHSETDILSDRAEYPLFIKPADSRGSRGQSVCFTKEEALAGLAAAKSESGSGEVICERLMEGHHDIASAFFVVDGEPYLVKFGDRHLGRKEDGLEKQVVCTQLPSVHSDMFMDKVHDRVRAMIRSLGIRFGPVFLQGFVEGDTVRYYDPAQRMPGGDYDLVLKEATGFDTVRSLIHFAMTGDTKTVFGDPSNAFRLNGGTAFLFTITARAGKMEHVTGFEEVLKHPSVVYGRQIIPEGETIPDTGDIRRRVAAFGAYIRRPDEIEAFFRYLYDTYKITDASGEDMIVSRYEYRRLP